MATLYASRGHLAAALPVQIPDFEMLRVHWNPRNDASAAHQWLLACLTETQGHL